MKKHFIFLYLIILFVLLTIIFVLTYKQQNQMKEISLADVEDALKSKQDRMVYYGQEDCGQCKEFSKYIRKIMSEQDVEICYLDSDKLNMVDKEKLMRYKIEFTPTLIVITKGKAYIYRNLDNKKDVENAITHIDIVEERFDELKDIDYEKLDEKMNENVDYFLYVGRDDCRDCQKFRPILEDYIYENPGAGMYYFDVKKYRELEKEGNVKEEEVLHYNELKKRLRLEWVPSVYHIRNGIVVDKYEFLNEDYYELDEDEKKEREDLDIQKFKDWMQTELLVIE